MKRTDPIPPPVPRGDVVGVLRRELWIAEDAGETVLAAQLRRRLAELDPDLAAAQQRAEQLRETAAAQPPQRETAARTTKPARTKPARSTRHVPRQ